MKKIFVLSLVSLFCFGGNAMPKKTRRTQNISVGVRDYVKVKSGSDSTRSKAQLPYRKVIDNINCTILRRLNEKEFTRAMDVLLEKNEETIAIMFLFCDLDDRGEQQIAEIISQSPKLKVVIFKGPISEDGARLIWDAAFENKNIENIKFVSRGITPELCKHFDILNLIRGSVAVIKKSLNELVEIHPGLSADNEGLEELLGTIMATSDFSKLKGLIEPVVRRMPKWNEDQTGYQLWEKIRQALNDIAKCESPV